MSVKTKPTLIETRMGKNCYEKEKLHLECTSKIHYFFNLQRIRQTCPLLFQKMTCLIYRDLVQSFRLPTFFEKTAFVLY